MMGVYADELVHAPPEVALASDVVSPTQIVGLPVIAFGDAFAVTVAVTWQPVDNS
jgi:hypothetical protein